ncbi:MAG: hypothetical protein AB7H97_10750 [Pseudobdellovibrionaceae bacterium]
MSMNLTKKPYIKKPKNSTEILPPLFYPAKTKLLKEGRIRKIGPRLYTSLPASKVESFVRAQWSEIVSELFPDALLSYRSAIEYKPSTANELFFTGTTNREIRFPGLKLVFIRGPKALSDDSTFRNFKSSSIPKDYLNALRALTRRDRPEPLIRMVERAQRFSHLEFSHYKNILNHLEVHNWFREPYEAKLIEKNSN